MTPLNFLKAVKVELKEKRKKRESLLGGKRGGQKRRWKRCQHKGKRMELKEEREGRMSNWRQEKGG